MKKKPVNGKNLALICARAALDKKASDVVVLEVTKLSSVTDYFVICHGTSAPQVIAIADNIAQNVAKAGSKILGEEGYTEARWILIDAGDVVAHVFNEPVRQFYDLERLWIHALQIDIPKEKPPKSK